MNETFVTLRDTISKRTETYPASVATKWLNHPVFGRRLEVVRSEKPEVIARAYLIVDGKRQYIDENGEKTTKDSAMSVEPVSVPDTLPDAPQKNEES